MGCCSSCFSSGSQEELLSPDLVSMHGSLLFTLTTTLYFVYISMFKSGLSVDLWQWESNITKSQRHNMTTAMIITCLMLVSRRFICQPLTSCTSSFSNSFYLDWLLIWWQRLVSSISVPYDIYSRLYFVFSCTKSFEYTSCSKAYFCNLIIMSNLNLKLSVSGNKTPSACRGRWKPCQNEWVKGLS